MSSLQVTDQESAAVAVAPRVALADIEDAIRQLWPLMGFALRDRLQGRWKTTNRDDETIGPEPPPCEWDYAGRMHLHPRYASGFCVECGAEAHEGCKDPLAVGEWAPVEG